jgi:nucleotide-binding universal stress UspA family protein
MRLKVLVPIDFSDNSRRALASAVDFVQSHEAEVYLFYVVEDSPRMGFRNAANKLDDDLERMKDLMIRELERLATEWGHKPHIGEVHRRIANGKPWEEILRMAGNITADVIFMGASHKGKNTAKVLEKAPCNVFIAREKDMEYVFPG